LRSELLFEVGELLLLQFALPNGRSILARGRVVRASRDSGKDRQPGMGVEFVDLSSEDRAAIESQLP
jgi:Tfp pilus assembly protein PilZ